MGFKPDNFILRGMGIELGNSCGKFSPGILIFIALCGPISNIALATLGYMMDNYLFFVVNISVALINFLPAFPLDGGQILYGLLVRHTNRKRSKCIVRISGRIISAFIICLGVCVLCISKYNFSLLYIGAFIFITSNTDFYNPVLEIVSVKEKNMYRCNIFMVNETSNALDTANSLPYNSIGAVKNSEGRVYDYITPLYLYNKLIDKRKDATMKDILKK